MEDALTLSVLNYQAGTEDLDSVRNKVLVEAFNHLAHFRRKGEDETSEFLLLFHGRIEGLVSRFQSRGLPFRHYLLRTLRWQWNTFRAERTRDRRRAWLAADVLHGHDEPLSVAETAPAWEVERTASPSLSPASLRRLVLLALKAAPYLDEPHLEEICRQTGVELPWLQACQYRLNSLTERRRDRRAVLVSKRSEAFYRRVLAEDEMSRESDPERRRDHEKRAGLYRRRLASLSRQQEVMSTSPTHLEVATLLGMPKGSVDSGLYHLKRELSFVYSGGHDQDSRGDEQRPQKAGT